ncbi:uncharacterized protein A4U43_C05F14410 [Asparagus officinalis]|uniref:Aminotransferase-like plant mobile domain-containing protein n=1 Tax=Asparagus officinalis TaxID=4686 RepID=A0A5P1EVX8_ASPOF|nr:uncharacterized protein A4U43_C05F14410 [Asparagus officinalis]
MTLLAGYLAIWLKKCVVPYQSGDIMPLEVLYPVVQLAYKKELSLFPVMVANIHRGLRQISSTFTQKEDAPSAKIPLSKVELPYTYLMACCLRMADGRGEDSLTSGSSYRLTSVGYFPLASRSSLAKYASVALMKEEARRSIELYFRYFAALILGTLGRAHSDLPALCRESTSAASDSWRFDGGLRAWLWTVTGCTGAKFSLPSTERQLNLTFLSCRWLLAANKTDPVKPIAELVAEEASQADSRVIWENARSQRTQSKTRRIDEEGKKIFHSADEASGENLEDYEDCSERGTAADMDEEFRPFF